MLPGSNGFCWLRLAGSVLVAAGGQHSRALFLGGGLATDGALAGREEEQPLGCRAPGVVVGEHLTNGTLDPPRCRGVSLIERAEATNVVRRQRLG